jgi:hypothetical protein
VCTQSRGYWCNMCTREDIRSERTVTFSERTVTFSERTVTFRERTVTFSERTLCSMREPLHSVRETLHSVAPVTHRALESIFISPYGKSLCDNTCDNERTTRLNQNSHYWSHVEHIPPSCHAIGRTLSIFHLRVTLLVAR